ncbi:universal stress protein [Streptomyces krungchingensis]|uniref:universal stress protein n=1 Tax=Streptomyces krungchingensis TaxID=1565034 RepID=UPI003CF13629
MFHRILVAVDGTAAGHGAVEATAELASLTGATVRFLHIDTSDVVYDTVVELEDDRTAHRTLRDAVSALQQASVEAERELLDGLVSDVAPAIEEAAQRFDADPDRRQPAPPWPSRVLARAERQRRHGPLQRDRRAPRSSKDLTCPPAMCWSPSGRASPARSPSARTGSLRTSRSRWAATPGRTPSSSSSPAWGRVPR